MHRSRKALWSLIAVMAAAVCLAASPAAHAQAKLRWKFNKGETLNYAMTQDMTQAMSLMGQNFNSKMKQQMDMQWKVDDVKSDGTAQITQKVTRVRFTMTLPPPLNQTIEYDSDDGNAAGGPLGAAIGNTLGAMVNAESKMTVDSKGEILDFKMPPELVEKLKQQAENASPFGGGGAGAVSEDSLKQMVSYGFLSFPDKALGNGDSWSNDVEHENPLGKVVTQTKYTYGGTAENGLHRIRSTHNMSLDPDPNAQIDVKMKSSEGTGEILFDNDAGRLRENKTTQKMTMEMNLNGQAIEQQIATVSTLQLVTGKTGSRSE